MQKEITTRGPLLDERGRLRERGYAKSMLLDYNPENIRLTPSRLLNRLRLKEWDYYGTTTRDYFFSVTVSHVGYIGLVFAYFLDFRDNSQTDSTIVLPLGVGCRLPHRSDRGDVHFQRGRVRIDFLREPARRIIKVEWPRFHRSMPLRAELEIDQPTEMDSIVMATPIGERCFYYNHKVNCMPTSGWIVLGDRRLELQPDMALTSLDWGRGVWPYRTFWNWASASGFLPDGRTIGLNLGAGFGDLSAATENCFYVDGRMTKLGGLDFVYDPRDFFAPWRFVANDGKLNLRFTPFLERTNNLNLGILRTEAHQMFGRYDGEVVTDAAETIAINKQIGWAEEHHAKW
jgi:hypothetical protein